jgi:hypothetical protein
MRIWIRILLLIKLMRIGDHRSTDSSRLHFKPPHIQFRNQIQFFTLILHSNAGLDRDPASKNNADSDPQHWFLTQMFYWNRLLVQVAHERTLKGYRTLQVEIIKKISLRLRHYTMLSGPLWTYEEFHAYRMNLQSSKESIQLHKNRIFPIHFFFGFHVAGSD